MHFKFYTRALLMLLLPTLAATIGHSQTCTVNWNDVHQRIDGFGASSAFSGRNWSDTTANIFFSTNNVGGNICIGLSLLRNQIQPGGFASTSELGLMKKAQALGARLWSTPWTPQASFKNNNNTVGGNFLSASNQAFANQLARYVATNASAGVNIYGLSIQNEPDANVTYVSCHWSAQQFHDFIPAFYNALVVSNVASTKIILPESQNWTTSLHTTAMNDPAVAPLVSVIANHNYVSDNNAGDQATPATVNNYGKAIWETEVSTFNPFDSSITNAMYWARRIHLFLTVPEVNAWHYWWLISGSTNNEGLMGLGDVPTKRMYVLGQFSRFVRPDYYRIGANTTGAALITAYKDSASPGFAIVAINTSSTAISQTFNLTNFTAASVTPWITSDTFSLSNQPAVAVTDSSFTYTLPAMSVVTFVGRADQAPTGLSLANASVPENLPAGTPVGNFSTIDPDAGDTFTYSLTGGTGDDDNGNFAITNSTLYTAALLDAAVQNTQSIRARTTDQNGLGFEKIFSVTVTPDTQARKIVSASAASDGNLDLTFTGIPGYAYRVQAATNLAAPVVWLDLTNNSDGDTTFTAGSDGLWLHTDLNATNFSTRFYRTVEP